MSVSIEKGTRVSLQKEAKSELSTVAVGVNWGAIVKRGFFGKKVEDVDLDASVGTFDARGNLLETVYFANLRNRNGSINHSGDDRTGDVDGDDGLDNETISIDLNKLGENVDQIAIVLNSFNGQDFKDIPSASIRLYEGTPQTALDAQENVLINYDISNDSSFAGSVSMVLGRIYKHNGDWKFEAIGQPTKDRRLNETLNTFKKTYL